MVSSARERRERREKNSFMIRIGFDSVLGWIWKLVWLLRIRKLMERKKRTDLNYIHCWRAHGMPLLRLSLPAVCLTRRLGCSNSLVHYWTAESGSVPKHSSTWLPFQLAQQPLSTPNQVSVSFEIQSMNCDLPCLNRRYASHWNVDEKLEQPQGRYISNWINHVPESRYIPSLS